MNRAGGKRIIVVALAGVAAIVAQTGCVDPANVGCTDVGCASGLSVSFEGTPDSVFTVTATGSESGPYVIQCALGSDCELLFHDYTPPHVTIVYESATRRIEQEFDVVYDEVWPNGRRCPPPCLVATVTLDLEA